MYYCKIAHTAAEFDAIAALNYETFVEEIPQHAPNAERRLIDRFHGENTYVVIYRQHVLIGMLAFRDKRPFSLDQKLGRIEPLLTAYDTSKLCEIRLLAIKRAYRNGRVFQKLAQAIYTYVYERGYSAAVISGVTREEKLYRRIGFEPFADVVGTSEAQFIPMILTRTNCLQMQQQVRLAPKTFYPGPTAQTHLTHTSLSHRSLAFDDMYERVEKRLLQLANARYVSTFVGSGTLANDVMLGQIRASFGNQQGLILMNGEFGARLRVQAEAWGLSFDTYEVAWGEAFSKDVLQQQLTDVQWVAFVHGETSTGVWNGDLVNWIPPHIAICADCISTFGAQPFSLNRYFLATAVSGKAIGALSGLAFVFANQLFERADHIPHYLQLARYQQARPYTLPAYLIANIETALQQYPARYALLAARKKQLDKSAFASYLFRRASGYPLIDSYTLPKDFVAMAQLNGLLLHMESEYLQARNIVQIATIAPTFETDFEALTALFQWYST